MTKLEAINGLVDGVYKSITHGDDIYYEMNEGNITIVGRKKTLDMKDILEEGWTGVEKPNWKDNIGNGILVKSKGTIYLCTAKTDEELFDAFGVEIPSDAEPITLKEAELLIWDGEGKKPEPKKPKRSYSKKPKNDLPKKEVENAPEVVDAELVNIPKKQEQVQKESTGDTAQQKEDHTENNARGREKKFPKPFAEMLSPFLDLGLADDEMETFWNFYKLDKIKLQELIDMGDGKVSDMFEYYCEEGFDQEHADPFNLEF